MRSEDAYPMIELLREQGYLAFEGSPSELEAEGRNPEITDLGHVAAALLTFALKPEDFVLIAESYAYGQAGEEGQITEDEAALVRAEFAERYSGPHVAWLPETPPADTFDEA